MNAYAVAGMADAVQLKASIGRIAVVVVAAAAAVVAADFGNYSERKDSRCYFFFYLASG